MNPALRHAHHTRGKLRRQIERRLQIETLNVRRSRVFTPIKSHPASSARSQLVARHALRTRHPIPARAPLRQFDQLVLRSVPPQSATPRPPNSPAPPATETHQHEIFPQAGNRNRRRSLPQIRQRSLKELLIGQHRQSRRSSRLQLPRQLCGIETQPESVPSTAKPSSTPQSPRCRSRLFACQRPPKPARHVRFRPPLQFAQIRRRAWTPPPAPALRPQSCQEQQP